MRINIVFFLSLFFFIFSCSEINFIYSEESNLKNPLYKKTKVSYSGPEIPSFYKAVSSYIGEVNDIKYNLSIEIEEAKLKKSVKTNQAISKIDYELVFKYHLYEISKNCLVKQKTMLSRFSYTPKSSGYNFGSDKSLERLYELAVKSNMQNFIDLVTVDDISKCLDES